MTDKELLISVLVRQEVMTRPWEAVQQAVSSPLLETTIKGATHVIINISGDISLMDANDAASYVQELTGEDANIIFGAMYDDSVADYARITVIATGLTDNAQANNPFGSKASNSVFSNKRPASTASAGVNLNMPSFSMPTMNATPSTAKTPSSTVQKKDIQDSGFLRKQIIYCRQKTSVAYVRRLFTCSRNFELLLLVFALESAALCFITFSGIISIYINGSGSTFTLVIVGAAAGFTVNLDGFAATAIFCTVHSTLAFS